MEGLRSNEEDGRSKRMPSAEEWEAAKGNIKYLYVTRNLPLSEIMERMEKLGFVATKRMYKARLTRWKLRKNTSRQDWLAFARLYQERSAAGIPEPFIQIYDKIRRIQDLRKYLKSHGEREDEFLPEAMAFQAPTPEHVHCCNSDGSDAMIQAETEQLMQIGVGMGEDGVPGPQTSQLSPMLPPIQQLNTLTRRKPSFVHRQSDLIVAGSSHGSQSSPASLRLQLPDVSLDRDFGQADSQVTTTIEGEWEHLTAIDMDLSSDQLNNPAIFVPFAEMSDLSSFQRIPDGDVGELYHNAYGDEPQIYCPLDGPQSSSMTAAFAHSQQPGPTLSHNDAHISYMTACMMACMFGAARKKDSMHQCLRRASDSFRQMCVLQSPFILMAAIHAEGSLSEMVMKASFRVATEALGSQTPACVLLEWMTAAVAADKLKACRVDSERLWQLWPDFNQALGEDHGHTIVALYCLSFHLMFADKDFAQAERHLEYLCVVSARVFGPFQIQTINILATLSRAQHRQKKYLPALETINKSLIAAPLGLNHPHRLELLLRKALILWRLDRKDEMEELYWIVVKGRVATLGIHHKTTVAAHNSLVDVLHWNGTWEARKDDAHKLLVDPQVSVSDYESWWRRVVEANRAVRNQDCASSEDGE